MCGSGQGHSIFRKTTNAVGRHWVRGGKSGPNPGGKAHELNWVWGGSVHMRGNTKACLKGNFHCEDL